MAIEVRLEDERGNEQAHALDTTDLLGTLARRDPASLTRFRLLRYIDPYGDTVFNGLQAPDLLQDIAELKTAISDEGALAFLRDLETLVARCPEGYLLRFYGD